MHSKCKSNWFKPELHPQPHKQPKQRHLANNSPISYELSATVLNSRIGALVDLTLSLSSAACAKIPIVDHFAFRHLSHSASFSSERTRTHTTHTAIQIQAKCNARASSVFSQQQQQQLASIASSISHSFSIPHFASGRCVRDSPPHHKPRRNALKKEHKKTPSVCAIVCRLQRVRLCVCV